MIATRFSLALIVSLLLAACNGASLQTIWKLRNVDLGALEPAQVRISINAPEWMGPMLYDLQLEVQIQPSGREPTTGLFQLRRVDRPEDVAAIQRAGLAADNLSIFEFAPQELKRIRQFQSQMTASKDAEDSGSESYQLQRKGRAVCLSFPPAGAPTTVNIYLHPTAEIGWVLIEANVDISELDLANSMSASDEAACRNFPRKDLGGKAVAHEAQPSGEGARKSSNKLDGGVSFHSGK